MDGGRTRRASRRPSRSRTRPRARSKLPSASPPGARSRQRRHAWGRWTRRRALRRAGDAVRPPSSDFSRSRWRARGRRRSVRRSPQARISAPRRFAARGATMPAPSPTWRRWDCSRPGRSTRRAMRRWRRRSPYRSCSLRATCCWRCSPNRETQADPFALLAAVERFARELRLDSDPEAIAGTRTALGALLRMSGTPARGAGRAGDAARARRREPRADGDRDGEPRRGRRRRRRRRCGGRAAGARRGSARRPYAVSVRALRRRGDAQPAPCRSGAAARRLRAQRRRGAVRRTRRARASVARARGRRVARRRRRGGCGGDRDQQPARRRAARRTPSRPFAGGRSSTCRSTATTAGRAYGT